MNSKLIISDFYKGILLGFLSCNGKIERIYHLNEENLLGNIYCGYVKDVVKNIHACFVEFDNGQKGYLSLKDFIDFTGNNMKQVHCGDKILIQVSGDKIKSKEYTLTSKINLNSECLVLTVGNNDISVSRKIGDTKKREELKELLFGFKNDKFGFILRTNSIHFSKEEIIRQAQKLTEQWQSIKKRFQHSVAKEALVKNNIIFKVCKEYTEQFGGEIITDNQSLYDKISTVYKNVKYYQDSKLSLCNKFALGSKLNEVLSPKVWLKSGAYLIIEPTEALTVIDVNSGKADLKTERTETIKKINTEAAKESLRQIKLRNYSGIIIIDFINMNNKEDYADIKSIMEQQAKEDFLQCNIVDFTKLGLLEISRKKKERPLQEILK